MTPSELPLFPCKPQWMLLRSHCIHGRIITRHSSVDAADICKEAGGGGGLRGHRASLPPPGPKLGRLRPLPRCTPSQSGSGCQTCAQSWRRGPASPGGCCRRRTAGSPGLQERWLRGGPPPGMPPHRQTSHLPAAPAMHTVSLGTQQLGTIRLIRSANQTGWVHDLVDRYRVTCCCTDRQKACLSRSRHNEPVELCAPSRRCQHRALPLVEGGRAGKQCDCAGAPVEDGQCGVGQVAARLEMERIARAAPHSRAGWFMPADWMLSCCSFAVCASADPSPSLSQASVKGKAPLKARR